VKRNKLCSSWYNIIIILHKCNHVRSTTVDHWLTIGWPPVDHHQLTISWPLGGWWEHCGNWLPSPWTPSHQITNYAITLGLADGSIRLKASPWDVHTQSMHWIRPILAGHFLMSFHRDGNRCSLQLSSQTCPAHQGHSLVQLSDTFEASKTHALLNAKCGKMRLTY